MCLRGLVLTCHRTALPGGEVRHLGGEKPPVHFAEGVQHLLRAGAPRSDRASPRGQLRALKLPQPTGPSSTSRFPRPGTRRLRAQDMLNTSWRPGHCRTSSSCSGIGGYPPHGCGAQKDINSHRWPQSPPAAYLSVTQRRGRPCSLKALHSG